MADQAMESFNIEEPQPQFGIVRRTPAEINVQQGYEGVPILKRPVWGWEIAWYFFVEGVSAGIYTLGTIADLAGAKRRPETITLERLVSLGAMMPAPVLLIADLGRPERFHHMLRVFKPRSPMNVGTWALSGYALFTTARAISGAKRHLPKTPWFQRFLAAIPERLMSIVGLPFSLTMLSYPGVLLSSTSIPVWAHSNFVGPLIACSSMSTAASAMTLVAHGTKDKPALKTLHRLENVVASAETAMLVAYVATAKKAAKPLVRGRQSKLFWVGAVALGILAPAILRTRRSKKASIAGSLLTLAGGLALKWAITHAGAESAEDRELSIHNARTSSATSNSGHHPTPQSSA
jgi:formate-dependent nitrite reductase membrane component NrfD